MKKVLLSLMLSAALVFGFTSCDKTTSESEEYSQTFTLGETVYPINNAFTIENIQHDGSQTYNVVVLMDGQLVGDNGGTGEGIILVFNTDILPGTYNMSYDPAHPLNGFPKYFFAEVELEDVIDFDINDLLAQDGVYVASEGSFTLETDGDIFTITTDGIEVKNVKDLNIVETSSADYDGGLLRYRLATVVEGDINDIAIVTAGSTKYTQSLGLANITVNLAAFINEAGTMIGMTSMSTSFENGLPVGSFSYDEYPVVYINGTDIMGAKPSTSGNVTISKDGEYYTVDMTDLQFQGVEGIYNLHYVGTMPYFYFPQ